MIRARGRNGYFNVMEVSIMKYDGFPIEDPKEISVELFSKDINQTKTPPVCMYFSIEEAMKFCKTILDEINRQVYEMR